MGDDDEVDSRLYDRQNFNLKTIEKNKKDKDNQMKCGSTEKIIKQDGPKLGSENYTMETDVKIDKSNSEEQAIKDEETVKSKQKKTSEAKQKGEKKVKNAYEPEIEQREED